LPGYLCNIRRSIIRASAAVLVFVLGISAFGPFQPGVFADTAPDLIVSNISLSPAEPAIDDTVSITVAVKNQGTGDSFGSYLVCYVDTTIIGTKYINPIDAGLTVTESFSWKATQGTHTIKAIADSTTIVAETDETNNSKICTLTTLAPDLAIPTLTWSPDNPSRGDTVTFSITINNKGSSASKFTNVNFYIDGVSRGAKDVAAIEPGKSVTKTYTWQALSGDHFLRAVIDESNNVKEGNETNNELEMTFATLRPDLLVKNIVWSPANPSKGDAVTFTIVFENQGSGRSDECLVNFFIDGIAQSTKTVAAINANATSNVTYSWTAKTDAHELKAIVDCYQTVTESNESNNEYTTSMTTLRPDLVVKDISWLPVEAVVGDTVTLSIVVANEGSGNAEPSRAICYVNGAVAGYIDFPVIEAGKKETNTLEWVAEKGMNAVSVTADYGGKIIESQEENNRLSTTIPVVPPDLIITNITYDPENPPIGDTVTFTVFIYNQGGGIAHNFDVANYLDDNLLTIEHVGTLTYGTTANVTTTWKSQSGKHTFKAVIDPGNIIPESEEDNNQRVISIAPNMPDLIVSNTTWSPAEISSGQEITFEISIKNQGTIAADPSRVIYYLDDVKLGYMDIGRLEPDSIDTEHLTWTATGGSHILKIICDANDQVTEANDDNNIRVVNLPPPDLIVQDISFSPSEAEVGDTVAISATVKNIGGNENATGMVTCYVDGIRLESQMMPELKAGATVIRTFDWIAKAGMHTVKFNADTNNEISESDETNNDKETVFSTMTPDLIIQNVSWVAGSTLTSDEVTIKVTVKNQGTGPAKKSQVAYIIDQNPAVYADILSIPAEGTAEFSFVKYLTKGTHTANITADAKSQVIELNETNNNKLLTFSTIAPDLALKSLVWTPMSANIGEDITFTLDIENRGRDDAIASRITFYVDNVTVETLDVPALNIGEITTVSFVWKTAAGPHEIKFDADVDGVITESDEVNNTKIRTLTFALPETTTQKSLKLQSDASANESLISKWWWLLLIVAVLLGGTAFLSAMKTLRKK
jgi:uncharacterized repeat protein (TIGR01451 family)